MGRRRVLVVAPAIARMQCMSNPYDRVKRDASAAEEEEEEEEGAGRGRSGRDGTRGSGFWASWRIKRSKAVKLIRRGSRGGANTARGDRRRRWGFRVSKLRIRVLSPKYWLKKLRDSYMKMMLAMERSMPPDCTGAAAYQDQYAGAAGAWSWPALAPPIVF